jgi:hypothetical protein
VPRDKIESPTGVIGVVVADIFDLLVMLTLRGEVADGMT